MKKNLIHRLSLTLVGALILGLGLLWSTEAQTLAFPGAEGYGRFAVGGRGGRVIEVTNLNNEGPGSFRQAAEVESGPRIVVFRVSGTMELLPTEDHGQWADIQIKNDSITIEGATAPGGGIALKNGGLAIQASHVIVRNIRVRPGLEQWYERGVNANGIMIMAKPEGGGPNHSVIVDHCTSSWGSDDMIFIIQGSDLVTVQYTLMYEGLECATCGNKGFLMAYGSKRVSFHHNYYAHTYQRWPELGQGDLDFVNNVCYDHNGQPTLVTPYHGPVRANFVGNYYKDGPNVMPSIMGWAEIKTFGAVTYSASSSIFVQGNIGRYRTSNSQQEKDILQGDGGGLQLNSSRFDFPLITTTDAFQAVEDVLEKAGAFPRDAADTRIVQQYRNGTGIWPETVDAVGGWPTLASTTPPVDSDRDGMPDSWETAQGLNPNNASDGAQDKDGDGYTNVEEYFHSLLAAKLGGSTVVRPLKPNFKDKTVTANKVKKCPLDIFGRTISENSKNSKKQTLAREIMNRKLGQVK